MCGAWQLQFTVHNFARTLQRVVVEQQLPDGTWVPLHGLPVIELRAQAAPQPRPNFHSSAGTVRGEEQVAISRFEPINGVVRYRFPGWPPGRKKTLGRPVVPRGFANSIGKRIAAKFPFPQARRSLIEPGRHGR